LPELRVHGGAEAGRRLRAPRGIRPTQGLVKEALFNILAASVEGAVVVDLFAGSGALGIEALSRGAARVTFVERDQGAAAILRQNLESLGYLERARSIRADAVRWLSGGPAEVREATLVLLDPPYGDASLDQALAALDEQVGDGATVVAEHARRRALPELRRLRPQRSRDYGDTSLTFLRAGA
jgi:16S rRNA (guanine966-N2)-methyltransferase